MNWKEVPVGGMVIHRGCKFLCIERGDVVCPSDACMGCDMNRKTDGRYFNCDPFKCGHFDRWDGKDVWFKLVGYVEDEG